MLQCVCVIAKLWRIAEDEKALPQGAEARQKRWTKSARLATEWR